MEQNDNEQQEYVLILEDRTEVKSEKETGKYSVVIGKDEQGKLKTAEPTDANQAAFLRQFNNPTHFGLYKVAAHGVEHSVEVLKTILPGVKT